MMTLAGRPDGGQVQPISAETLRLHRHPSEITRFWLTLLIVVPAIAGLIAAVFATFGAALLAVAVIIGLSWLVMKLVIASYLGNFVRVSEDNFPEVNQAILDAKAYFQYSKPVDAYVLDGGNYNIFLMPLLRRKVLLINSDILENISSDNEVKWLVARFIGGLVCKHYRFMWLQVVLNSLERLIIFNILLYPYERAVVKSGDQLGLLAVDGDIESALRAMHKFMVGNALVYRVNLVGTVKQQIETEGSFFAWLAKCLSPFPHTSVRVVGLLRHCAQHYPENVRALLTEASPADTQTIARAAGLRPDRALEQGRTNPNFRPRSGGAADVSTR